MFIHGFEPVASPDATRLILGSMPGKASLAAGQYYAHARNSFWRIMDATLRIPLRASYASRCSGLTRNRIALWDVLRMCTRASSLDSDIVESSIVPNDFEMFLVTHPDIGMIYFNGAKAEQMYRRYVLPALPDRLGALPMLRLPSTSPANASLSYDQKLAQWNAVR